MADILVPVGNSIVKRFHDNADGTFSEVVYVGGSAAGGAGAVDTELETPIALADNMALPTVPRIISVLTARNSGTTVDALRQDGTGALRVSLWGKNAAAGDTLVLLDASGRVITTIFGAVDTELPAAAALSEAMANPTAPFVASAHSLFNGATWDRQYNNTTGTLLASAARTADTPSADQINYNARGLVLFLNITAMAGTGIRAVVQFKDPLTGNYAPSATGSIAGSVAYQTALAMYTYLYYLGATNTQGYTQVVNTAIPRTWRAVVQTQDGLSATYSLGFAYIM